MRCETRTKVWRRVAELVSLQGTNGTSEVTQPFAILSNLKSQNSRLKTQNFSPRHLRATATLACGGALMGGGEDASGLAQASGRFGHVGDAAL